LLSPEKQLFFKKKKAFCHPLHPAKPMPLPSPAMPLEQSMAPSQVPTIHNRNKYNDTEPTHPRRNLLLAANLVIPLPQNIIVILIQRWVLTIHIKINMGMRTAQCQCDHASG
jgi:hypothetical protein